MCTAEPLVPEPSAFRIEIAIDTFKRYKSSGIDEIQTSLIQARGRSVRSEVYELINSVWNMNKLPQ
jgi:hypothetical protein